MPVRKEYVGGAPETTLTADPGSGGLSITVASGTGYPTGAANPFVIELGAATSSLEKVLCDSRSGNTFTVNASGRGYDNTTAQAHAIGTPVNHVLDAVTLTDLSAIAYQAAIQALYGLTPAADRFPYFTSSSAAALGTITAFARTLLDDANAAAFLATLDAELAAIAGLTSAADVVPVFSGSGTAAAVDFKAGAWGTYTPALTQNGARTTSTQTGRYASFGKLVVGRFDVIGSEVGTTGNVVGVSLPVAPQAGAYVGFGVVEHAGAVYRVIARSSASVALFRDTSVTTSGEVGVTPAFALAVGTRITCSFMYEAA